MPEYDFHQLSPYDLEILVRDLLQAHWNVTIESFKGGRDGGIDLRYAKGPDQTIVQVKHYIRTGLTGLLRELRSEALKMSRLQPSRYVLVTSVPLSAANKKTIVEIFNTPALTSSDVVGMEDLNNLLSQHPTIEKNHYKLWLASKPVLDRVLHNAAVTRSEFKVRQIYRQARRYVSSSAFPKAMEILDNERVVMISGSPGVGKTTLADLLLYNHLEKGYQAVLIERDPLEGLDLFQPNTRQIFYYDDFMGATFVGDQQGATLGNEDKALLTLINMVRETPSARLVLTTREHVYSKALGRSERLREAGLDELRVMMHMPNYNRSQKAAILYNHIYFSELAAEYQDRILSDGFYLKIVKHEKFNPRLIEWLSNYKRVKVSVDDYRSFITDLLDDPSEIWQHAYRHEISEAARSILLSLWSVSGRINADILRTCFSHLHEGRSARYHFSTRAEDYSEGVHDLANSFVKPTERDGIEVIDPSVLDLMNSVVREAPANATDLLANAQNFNQVDHIWRFAKQEANNSVLKELKQHTSAFASRIGEVAALPRRVSMGGGSFGLLAPNYEVRIIVMLQMANTLVKETIGSLIAPIFAQLETEWLSSNADISSGLALLRAVTEDQPSVAAPLLSQMRRATEVALNHSISLGVPAEELQEVIDGLYLFKDANALKLAVQAGFNRYVIATQFHDDLSAVRTSSACADLIDTLKLIGSTFEVNTVVQVSKVELEMRDLEEAENQRADYEHDMWKDRRGDERGDERQLTEMFSTLRGNR